MRSLRYLVVLAVTLVVLAGCSEDRKAVIPEKATPLDPPKKAEPTTVGGDARAPR